MGPGSGLQDPRELQEKSGIRESGQEGSAGGFKILVFCRPGAGAGREKKKRAKPHTGDLDTQMRRSTALRMFLSYVVVQTRKEERKLRSTI
jgi:hypothetical protein